MAEIITKDSEEFKELTGWMKKIGKSVEAATARIRPAIADKFKQLCRFFHFFCQFGNHQLAFFL